MADTLAASQQSKRTPRPIVTPGGDWPRRWTLPQVAPRANRFRDRYRRCITIGIRSGELARRRSDLLLYLLDTAAGKTGKPIRCGSRAEMAEDLGWGERTVKRWCDELEALGWLTWRHNQTRTARGFICQRPNTYLLLIPAHIQARLDAVGSRAPRAPIVRPRHVPAPVGSLGLSLPPLPMPAGAAAVFEAQDALEELGDIPPGMTVAEWLTVRLADRSPP